jgi:hypothetical protein
MITERAMLAAIHISIWTAVKHDRKVSHEVARQNGAPENAGRYNKKLLRGADKLDALRTLGGQIRQHFYKITLPWSDEGYRLLPAHFYFDLTAQMREFEQAFSRQVEDFLTDYPTYIEQVRPELNGLFREEDYPSSAKLREKFSVKLEVLPIPSGDDFRVTLSAEEQARVAREIDENVRQSLQRGTEDLWKRLKDVVTLWLAKMKICCRIRQMDSVFTWVRLRVTIASCCAYWGFCRFSLAGYFALAATCFWKTWHFGNSLWF